MIIFHFADEDLESQTVYDYVRDDEEDDYDYAAVPDRSEKHI